MDPYDLILTLAEISIAYVGFAAVVGVLSTRTADWTPDLRLLFRALIEIGLFSLLLCTLPHVLAAFEMPGADLWTYASATALVGAASMAGIRIYQVRTRLGHIIAIGKFLLIPLNFASLILFALNATIWKAAGPYVVGIMILLVSASSIFLALIYNLFPVKKDD